ncbi:TPA: hypothetical protein I8Y21_004592 [Klebsiella oxytoca]|uniref:Phage tail protein n=1 Tax=Klebsiella oxytoca TaxID=571 RepID=A0AAN5LBC6_KLEOX|nr:hypothetical protein [Klebsiella oxytoca]
MNQLESLTDFLTAALGERVMDTCEIDTGTSQHVTCPKALGLGYLRVAATTFDAEFTWYDWPYRQFSSALLPALMDAWLQDNDGLRDDLALAGPSYDKDPGDDNDTMIVTLRIGLYEEIILREDDNGPVIRLGQRYSLAEPEIWTARDAEYVIRERRHGQ